MATITSATSGPSNATSTWAGGVVPVLGDKVIIAHPGTNILGGSILYSTSAVHLAGATSIPLTGGGGSIVAGECVQFNVQIGTDEDGEPIWHNGYYKVVTGITANGTITIEAPGLLIDVPSGTQVINAGHVVTLQATHAWGDDTSSTTIDNNAIVVRGTLRASRTVSSDLTCRGSCVNTGGATYDFGVDLDEIPSGVSAVVRINDSASLSASKHIFGSTTTPQVGLRVKIAGTRRTRNTRLTSATAANATSITVDESLGWQIGDRLIFASATDDLAGAQFVSIVGGASPTWSISALPSARAAGCRVGNLTSNVEFRAASANHHSSVAFSSTSTAAFARVVDAAFVNAGAPAGWTTASQPENFGALGFRFTLGTAKALRIAVDKTNVAGTGHGIAANQRSLKRPTFQDCAIFAGPNGYGFYCGQLSRPVAKDCVWYSCNTVVIGGYGGGSSPANIIGGAGWSLNGISFNNELPTIEFDDFEAHNRSDLRLFYPYGGICRYRGGSISGGSRLMEAGGASSGVIEIVGTTFLTAVLDGSNVISSSPAQECLGRVFSINGDPSDNRVLSHYQTTATDAATRKRSTYSVKLKPNIANTPIIYTFNLPAVAGAAQTIKGSLRFDSTYGTTTPPSIAVSGQGVSQSFTAPASANAWHDFSLAFTPTATGELTVVVTINSASTAGFAWLDGVYHYPMTQVVRHFGFQWLPQANQVADARVSLTEAASLALPVSVNHGTSTITVSGPVSNSDVWHACMADLCQTANISRAVHVSSADGAVFSTTYTVSLSGTGAISGVYTDSAGVHVQIVAPALIAGSRVQLYSVTDSTELFNGVLPADGLVFDATWTANKTVRLRAEHNSKLPLQTIGVLTSSGLSFLDVQAEDGVYLSNGIDGSTCTEFAADGANVQIDIDDPDGVTSVQRLYAWMQWYQTTSAGIASAFFGAVSAIDAASYTIDQALVDIKLDNVGATPVRVVGGYLSRKDGSTIIAAASGSIQMDPGKAYVAGMSAPIVLNPGERLLTTSGGNLYAR